MRYWILLILCYLCWACSTKTDPKAQRVLTDTTFYAVLKQVPELKLPLKDKKWFFDDSLKEGYSLHWNKTDSTFMVNYMCLYENYCYPDEPFSCGGRPFFLLGKKQLNDSVYVIIYRTNYISATTKESPLLRDQRAIVMTFNVNQSCRAIDRLVISGYSLGRYEQVGCIDSFFNIHTTRISSMLDCQKHVQNNIPLDIINEEYKLLPDGRIRLTKVMKSFTVYGQFSKDNHFYIEDSSSIRIDEIKQYRIDEKTGKRSLIKVIEPHNNYVFYERLTARLTPEGELVITDSLRRKTPLKE